MWLSQERMWWVSTMKCNEKCSSQLSQVESNRPFLWRKAQARTAFSVQRCESAFCQQTQPVKTSTLSMDWTQINTTIFAERFPTSIHTIHPC